MPKKAGITDSGKAAAATSVARQLRKNTHTTITASTAPSYSSSMEPSKFSCTGWALSITSLSVMSGRCADSAATALRTPRLTSSSPAPLVRSTSKPTTIWPSCRASERASAVVSSTRATWSSRMCRPSASGMSSRASSPAVLTVAIVRTDCSAPPTSPRPPGASCCTSRSRRDTSMAATLSAAICAASSSTRISRFTPPTRLTPPTPGTPSRRLVTVSSTNQLTSCRSRRGVLPSAFITAAALKVSTGRPAVLTLVTCGSRISPGRSARMLTTASRTSVTASEIGFSRMNSTITCAWPSSTLVVMFFTPCRLATASSSLRATSVSSCAGAAPSSVAVTMTTGSSMSGKSCTPVVLNASRPTSVSMANSSSAGTGLRME